MTLELRNVSVRLRGATLFAPLSLVVRPGEVATVMGPSGVGKSTLLDAIGGHLGPGVAMAGQVILDGADVGALPAEERRIGPMAQGAGLFPHLSVGESLAFGLARSVRGRAALAAGLERAGLSGMEGRDPATLSGGQRARAALMRTLLAEPRALLLDEPFAALDQALRAGMRDFVFCHVRARGIPALMVTPDPADAAGAGGEVVAPSGG